MAYEIQQLLRMTQSQLDELFTASPVGDIPDGEGKGTAIIARRNRPHPGNRRLHQPFRLAGQNFRRQGRVCSRTRSCHSASPPSSPGSTRARAGSTARNASCSTTRETSLVAGWIRDEIRMIEPGFYLGQVFGGRTRLFHFTLQF